ncbi:MAG: CDGSH-type Zn-finger protein/uncharacterized Fe-S cluster protein YjdI [Cognaticolwellia sp.]
MSKKSYLGKGITVEFDGARCIHARRCVLGLPGVFQPGVPGDWVNPDGAPADEIAALIRQCPSGALSFTRDAAGEATPTRNVVRLQENGPLEVHADLTLDGETAPSRRVLCRCGASKRKPYCDGSHKAEGFKATGEPAASDPVGEGGKGPLSIQSAGNGPLLVSGPVEIIAGSGRALKRTSKTALCRCGASKNKPYCDGSHFAIGFES